MTDVLDRSLAHASAEADAESHRSLWLRGSLAAVWAVSVGVATLVVVALIAWAADARSGSSAGAVIRSALQIWLAGHRVPLQVAEGSIAIAPLGLTLLLAFVVARAGAVLARGVGVDGRGGVGLVSLAIGVPYAVLGAFVAAAATSTGVRPSPVGALLGAMLLGCGGAAWGAARGSGLIGVRALLPEWARGPVSGGAAAAAVVAVGSLVLLIGSLGAHAAEAVGVMRGLGGGMVATTVLVALDVALVPNAVGCLVGYVAGPGFAIGSGTSITLAGSQVGAVPALPLLAALPHGGAPAGVRLGCGLLLVAAGAVAGWRVAREPGSLLRTALRAAAAGAVAGVLAALLVALSGGSAGPGRMAVVGASPWQAGLALAGEVGAVAVVAATLLRWRRYGRV